MKKGFSYIETIIVLAIFSVALLPLIPILSHAHRNEIYSRETYIAQLHAKGIMAVARNAALNNWDIENKVEDYMNDLESPPYSYGVWYGETLVSSEGNGLDISPSVKLDGLTGKIITVVCWGEDNRIHGRAIGIVPEKNIK